jgi:thymidylate synthase (FAD)
MNVRLVDVMGNDAAIVQAARISYGDGTKTVSEDRALIRFLMRHRHTTPFEMVAFKFHLRMPIFVARQWLRHRTASVNEYSARYSVVPDDYWVPDKFRKQSMMNKQCSSSDGEFENEDLKKRMNVSCEEAFRLYDDLLEAGCSRELARTHLPQSTYTEFYWTINLHNLLHFLELRLDSHAQPEIQECAKGVYDLIKPVIPLTTEAFEDFRLTKIYLSRLEIEAIREGRKEIPGQGENREFQEKLKSLGL